ncbi:MAG TPA: DNA methyltransferase [Chloroflexota bacterium]|jgi:hypothetical protein
MPVADMDDRRGVDQALGRILDAATLGDAVQRLRDFFVGQLDFDGTSGTIPLHKPDLPSEAILIARRESIPVVAVALPRAERVLRTHIQDALGELRNPLGREVLLVITDESRDYWHFVYPSYQGDREILRRMVIQSGQPRRTVVERLAGIFDDARTFDLRKALDNAYDVEAVTTRFFKEYGEIFHDVMDRIEGLPESGDRRLFVQRLFNRLMFIAFVQRKGWLRFNGDKDYLDALWRDYQKKRTAEENFYQNRLWLLFTAGLNTPNSVNIVGAKRDAWLESVVGDVPYLNGGLFDPDKNKADGKIAVPDECIDAILNGLFKRFNFTVTESTPWDVEVAVDPEMLGKVFEKLVTGRHETGSYYTPKPVVGFMCREALKGYLQTSCPGETAAAVERFVDDVKHDATGLKNPEAVLDALRRITVCDPACGSGAYLLGMLHELLDLRHALFTTQHLDPISAYHRKREIIQNSVYGVDKDGFAVNIACLRLWLSLVVEFDGEVKHLRTYSPAGR